MSQLQNQNPSLKHTTISYFILFRQKWATKFSTKIILSTILNKACMSIHYKVCVSLINYF